MVEGGQASLVGLPPVDPDLYKESHQITHKIMTTINTGDNLDRYLMGRQFMVLALVFVENLCGEPLHNTQVLGLPNIVIQIFMGFGLALFFMTAMLAKISAQVNASRCMLDYVDNYFAQFTMRVAMLIEMSGLLHCCYLVQMFFAWASGQPLNSKEKPRNCIRGLFFWIRVLVSCAILAFAFVVTITALFQGRTTMWEGVPPGVAVFLFFLFMAIVGMLEGMQIAFFAVAQMTEQERSTRPWAKRTCDVLFANDGRNLPGFMVGRQMCVTLCFFIVARVTTIKAAEDGSTLFGVPPALQAFFETGLLGALITTIVASITWQLVASAFPMAFLSTPITYVLLRFCLLLEWTGLCQGAWVIAMIQRKCTRYNRDEVYIGTAEERAAKGHADDAASVASAHMYPGTIPALPPGAKMSAEELAELEAELEEHIQQAKERLQDIREKKLDLKRKGVSDGSLA